MDQQWAWSPSPSLCWQTGLVRGQSKRPRNESTKKRKNSSWGWARRSFHFVLVAHWPRHVYFTFLSHVLTVFSPSDSCDLLTNHHLMVLAKCFKLKANLRWSVFNPLDHPIQVIQLALSLRSLLALYWAHLPNHCSRWNVSLLLDHALPYWDHHYFRSLNQGCRKQEQMQILCSQNFPGY